MRDFINDFIKVWSSPKESKWCLDLALAGIAVAIGYEHDKKEDEREAQKFDAKEFVNDSYIKYVQLNVVRM